MAIVSRETFFTRTGPQSIAPADIVRYTGAVYAARIDPTTGHYTDKSDNSVLVTEERGLRLPTINTVGLVMSAAILDSDAEIAALALKAIEAVLAYRNTATIDGVTYTGPDGSFPAHAFGATKKTYKFHNKVIAMHNALQSLRSLKESVLYTGDLATDCDTLIGQLADYVGWITDPASTYNDKQVMDHFFKAAKLTNQALRLCAFLQEAGIVYEDAALLTLSEGYTRRVFDEKVSEDGVFYEALAQNGVGFDGDYGMLSGKLLAEIHMNIADAGEYKTLVLEQLTLLATRWLQTVNQATGFISSSGWSRNKEYFPRSPFALSWPYSAMAYKALTVNFVAGDSVIPDGLTDLIFAWGQQFGHISGNDDDDDNDSQPENAMIILDGATISSVVGVSSEVDWAAIGFAPRTGGGACAAYPGGTLPDPCAIVSPAVLGDTLHAEHYEALSILPVLTIDEPGFPPAF